MTQVTITYPDGSIKKILPKPKTLITVSILRDGALNEIQIVPKESRLHNEILEKAMAGGGSLPSLPALKTERIEIEGPNSMQVHIEPFIEEDQATDPTPTSGQGVCDFCGDTCLVHDIDLGKRMSGFSVCDKCDPPKAPESTSGPGPA
jgi:hypothetical protein